MKNNIVGGAVLIAVACAALTAATTAPIRASLTADQTTARTATAVFELPHGLGILPASELKLAEANPGYAAGLDSPKDWRRITVRTGRSTGDLKQGVFWEYVGRYNPNLGAGMTFAVEVKGGAPIATGLIPVAQLY